MSLSGCRFLAVLSACGIIACVSAYIASFLGPLPGSVFRWGILLILAMIVLFIPLYVLEYPASRSPTFFLKGFARGMPSWVAPCSTVLFLVGIAHLIWFALHSGWGVPAILDGQYVLDSGGQTLKVLTETEYRTLKAEEVRTFAAMTASFYFVPMMYRWFRRIEPPRS
jgi:hypothetical protein